ncbi:MAG TPA: hypothetical protein VMM16_05115 [Verrucomicrobiae bacterium]|nr:hypothetical protein [Verrucomicrobiae bacterium]
MRSMRSFFARRTLRLLRGFAVFAALLVAPAIQAQTDSPDEKPITPAPVFQMGSGFITTFQGGTPHLGPLINPVLLVPVGNNWLIEARGDLESDLAPPPGSGGFTGNLETNVDYLQIDYIANKYVTFTAGRFLTPFGIYNERLYPIWIRDLQTDPLILPLEGGEYGSSNGAMVRGGFDATSAIEINYAAYFSANSTIENLSSDRSFGFRSGIFLPGPRLEVGGSFQHLLQEYRKNSVGVHFEWQPRPLPLDIRAEYARSWVGSGYWVEGAYKLSQIPVWRNTLRHVQMVGRMQQFYEGAGWSEDVPGANTNMFEYGINYYFRDDIRFVSSYGRQFAPDGGNMNVWTVGLTYRLAMPIGPGEMR